MMMMRIVKVGIEEMIREEKKSERKSVEGKKDSQLWGETVNVIG